MSAASRTRPRSRRTKAKSVRYTYDSDTVSEDGTSQQSRPSRRSQRIQTYQEDSDESTSNLESLSPDLDSLQQSRPRKKRYSAPPTRSKTNKRKRDIKPAKPSKQNFQLFKRRKPNTHDWDQKRFAVLPPLSGKVPPWQELPYQVLQQVMRYASYPFYEKASRTTASIEWLCGVSLLCKSFHEACIAALLYSPPLFPSFRAHGLLHLLAKNQDETITNYRTKIKCLDIEVKNLLIRKSGIDILELLGRTPLLESLRLYHNHDDLATIVWAQPSQSKGKRWAYPDELFQKLDEMNIKLKSWEWNGRFPSSKDVLQTLSSAHVRQCFSEIQSLSFLNITLPDKASEEDTTLANTLMISALDRLPNLKNIAIRNCNVLNTSTLARLPPALTSLEIMNCQYLTSDLLSLYLSTAGSSLESLNLVGNQSMSLAFLTNLSSLCPKLRQLKLDLTYTDPSSYRDRDPLYDEALPDGPPSWPSSLVSIAIENLRQVSSSKAEDFLASLVDAAPRLSQLKKIVIKAIIKDGSWRDRAEIRKKWIPRLEHVFLDTSEPTVRRSIKQPQVVITKRSVEIPEPKQKKDETLDEQPRPAGRQSSRLARLKDLNLNQSNSNSNSNNTSESDDSADADSSGSSPTTLPTHGMYGNGGDTIFRQGRCSIVTLVLSDQRPAQDQYHEQDFLDSERSGDEEWNGRDMDFD